MTEYKLESIVIYSMNENHAEYDGKEFGELLHTATILMY